MSTFQGDLVDFSKDVDDFAADLATNIDQKSKQAGSEPDFRQRIRGDLQALLDEFDLSFDHVDEQIGTVTHEDIEAVLDTQGLSFQTTPFDQDTIRTGGMKPDAVVGACAVDFKARDRLSTESGRQRALGQIVSYLVAVADRQNVDVSDTAGVVLDGKQFLFVHGDDLNHFEYRPLNEATTAEFATLLVSRWATLTADRLIADFGADRELSSRAVNALFETLQDGDERSEIIFEEWKLLFEQVCGFEFTKGKEVLEEYYDLDINNEREFRQALFALFTYYALIAKLIAGEFAYYHADSRFLSFLKRLVGRSDEELRDQLDWLEEGYVFNDAGIENFLEASLFSWYADSEAWNEDVATAIRSVVERMRKYDPGRLRDDPQQSRDVFKNLYQHVVPEELRKQLGEVFTPDWLAELTLERAGYDGDGRLLDPACGSGTFLVLAAREKKAHYSAQYEDELSPEEKADLAERLLDEIEGFDLNPLAVLAARTNLLIELGELLEHCESVELPVYLCDSVRPPSPGGTLSGSFYQVREVPTDDGPDADIEIKVPMEVIDDHLVNEYFDLAGECPASGADAEVFIERFDRSYGIETARTRSALKASYQDMAALSERDVDGIWWGVVKNRFRPRFAGRFEYVIGNPPYITLGDLPAGYRQQVQDEWESYDILPTNTQSGPRKGEHALLFACKAVDSYLADNGTLSFVMPLTVQRGGNADGFRRYVAQNTSVRSITDVADLEPFDVSRNRALILTTENGSETEFPVPCETWIGSKPAFGATLETVRSNTEQCDFAAAPMTETEYGGKWFSAPKEALNAFEKIFGIGDYEGREGINTIGGTGLFLIDVLDKRTTRVRNTNRGRTDWGQVAAPVDSELIYPATNGGKVDRWEYDTPDVMFVPHDDQSGRAYTDDELLTGFPDTRKFLHNRGLSKAVGERKLYGTMLKDRKEEEHYLHAVGARMFEPYKTVYKDISGGTYIDVQAATVGPQKFLREEKPVMFTHTLMHVPAESKQEAYYLSAVLNSAPVRAMMRAHSVLHANPRAIEEVDIPKFDENNDRHATLAARSEAAHEVDEDDRNGIETEINELIADVFDLTATELDHIQSYLDRTRT